MLPNCVFRSYCRNFPRLCNKFAEKSRFFSANSTKPPIEATSSIGSIDAGNTNSNIHTNHNLSNLPKFTSTPSISNTSSSSSSPIDSPAFDHLEIDIGEDGLLKIPQYTYIPPHELTKKSGITPLVLELHSQIKIRGPLPVYDYFFQCLQNPQYGYYMNKQNIIGPEGDFITSPELNQIFSELVGLYAVQIYNLLNQPNKINIIELGPGKGTLIKLMLHTIKQLNPKFHDKITVHCVETSPTMRQIQQQTIGVEFDEQSLEIVKKVAAARSFDNDQRSKILNQGNIEEIARKDAQNLLGVTSPSGREDEFQHITVNDQILSGKNADGVQFYWHSSMKSIEMQQKRLHKENKADSTTPAIIFAHEFFDALPVYQFQLREKGWCEVSVDIDSDPDTPHHLRFVLAPGPTAASRAFVPQSLQNAHKTQVSNNNNENKNNTEDTGKRPIQVGDFLEVCPTAFSVTEQITQYISRNTGSALIIDYGTVNSHNTSRYTLQAVKAHNYVSPLLEPGTVDLTTLVDFQALYTAVQRTIRLKPNELPNPIQLYPIITQSTFLRELGIAARLEKLYNTNQDNNYRKNLLSSATRLVSLESMGGLFKCLALSSGLSAAPVPFHIQVDNQLEQYENKVQKDEQQQKAEITKNRQNAALQQEEQKQ